MMTLMMTLMITVMMTVILVLFSADCICIYKITSIALCVVVTGMDDFGNSLNEHILRPGSALTLLPLINLLILIIFRVLL